MKKHVTVVILDHPVFAALSSVVEKKEFTKERDALKHSRDLMDVYLDKHYTIVCQESPFDLNRYIGVLGEMREERYY